MSRLAELIAEFCPEGVEYKELDKLLKIKNGSDYKKFSTGAVPVYGSGGIMAYIDTFAYDKPSVLIPRKGSVDKLYYVEEPFWNVDTIFYTEIDVNQVIPRYVYYCLQREHLEQYNTAGGVPSLTKKVLSKVKIPVPPLPVQCEIVRILDNFTELTAEITAELTAELTARKRQYEFYRDKLLTFDVHGGTCDIEWKSLGEFCDLLTGYPFESSQFREDGIRLLRCMNIKRGVLEFNKEINKYWIDSAGFERFLLNSGDIVIAMDGSLVGKSYGFVVQSELPMLLVQRVARIRTSQANSRYVYHYISSGAFSDYVEKKKTMGAVPHISLKDVSSFLIPLPSLKNQEKIVEILDRFDTLCNDLTSGLPAEIEARQKQYEYYRDKLLSFKELKA